MSRQLNEKLEEVTLNQLEYWCKYSVWDIHQAVTLSLGRDPDIFTLQDWEEVEHNAHGSFIEKYKELNKILNCAIKSQELEHIPGGVYSSNFTSAVKPLEFITWAKKKNLLFRPELERLVQQHNNASSNEVNLEMENSKLKEEIEELKKERHLLTERNNKLEQEINSSPSRITKMIAIAGLTRKYGLENILSLEIKTEGKSKKVTYTSIAKDLELTGMKFNHETLKKYIVEYLPLLKKAQESEE
jgi:hypothetical protein